MPRFENILAEYKPRADRPWDTAAAAHLLRRAGFQAGLAEVKGAVERGPKATVDLLVDGGPETSRAKELDDIERAVGRTEDLDAARGWWLARMVRTARPLRARMAVFWHNHFATSNQKVMSAPLMMKQLETIEARSLGRFEDLLLAMSRDPAMIVWLDGDSNIKGRPNENYARELFELFALGVGNYTEQDIKEAARAFTGWHQRQGEFRFFERDHDTTSKTVFGTSGNFGGEDIVKMAIAQPACSRFIAGKLLAEFLCSDPDKELVEALASRLREADFNIGETLRTLLASEAMFDPRWRRARIKSPVEFVVGVCRSLETKAPARSLIDSTNQMGQRLLEPPSVKGWSGHRAWLNSSTVLLRLAGIERLTAPDGGGMLSVTELRSRHGLDNREEVLAYCSEITLDGCLPAEVESKLAALTGKLDVQMRMALRILMSTPEYQLA